MTRSLKKGPYVDKNVLKKIERTKPGEKILKTWARSCTVTPEMVGYIFGVYNGKEFIEVHIKEEMIGHKLGEFSPTKKFIKHGGKVQREAEKKGKK